MGRQSNLERTDEEAASKRRLGQNTRPTGNNDAHTVQGIISHLGILHWDLLFIGDGSGSAWSGACGWAGVLVDKLTREYSLYSGAMNAGSITLAELMPYYHALTWYHANAGRHRLKTRTGVLYVHIVTDSKVITEQGREACDITKPLPKVQQALWATFREFTKLGYNFSFHWQERSTSLMNQCCDLVASLARRSAINTTQGKVPEAHREDLLSAEQGLRRLSRAGVPPEMRATVEAGLRALQLLLFEEQKYADQLAAALAEVRISDPTSLQPLELAAIDGHVLATEEPAA